MAKGGGSANKSYLYQETKAVLNPAQHAPVPGREGAHAGHRRLPAVPPRRRRRRHVGRVRAEDGEAARRPATSTRSRPSATSSAAASATTSSRRRSLEPDAARSGSARSSAASTSATTCGSSASRATAPAAPIAIAVSCSADRQALGKITADGVFLEQLEADPAQFLPEATPATTSAGERRPHRPQPPDERGARRALPATR